MITALSHKPVLPIPLTALSRCAFVLTTTTGSNQTSLVDGINAIYHFPDIEICTLCVDHPSRRISFFPFTASMAGSENVRKYSIAYRCLRGTGAE